MPPIRRQDDPARSLQWLVWDEQPQVARQAGDATGLALLLTWQVQRAATPLAHLIARWGEGSPPPPGPAPRAELDLTQEFIAVGLQPVLCAKAVRPATQRQQVDKRSQSQQHLGEPLCRDAERLCQIKVANLEHATILQSLLTQGGRLLWHPEKRILLSVAHRFANRRLQAAYERYCVFLNQLQIQVPMDASPLVTPYQRWRRY